MVTEPEDEITAQAIRTLKAALVQGRLTEDEYDERISPRVRLAIPVPS